MSESCSGDTHLRLRLEADGRGELFDRLEAALGMVLAGRYRVETLLAVGRQGFLYRATDLERNALVAVKQPALDYSRPLTLDRSSVSRARRAVAREHEVLTACTAGALPEPFALIEAPHIIPAARTCAALGASETYLVEELIDGATLTAVALQSWSSLEAPRRERNAAQLANAFVDFWRNTRAAGWHYGDVSADNILIERRTERARLVDAASCVRARGEVRLEGYSPAFMTPRLLERAASGLPLPGTLACVLPPLAKVLHFALTRREPLTGALPDLQDDALLACSPACRTALGAMLAVDDRPDPQRALVALDAWARVHS